MSANPIVSVVIPCYNAEKFIGETIRSVLDQSLRDLEVIVVDDGSTDNSETMIQGISDPRINYIKTSNHGVSKARNTGLAVAKGKYVSWLDADDLFETSNLQKKVHFLEDNPDLAWVHSQEIVFESKTGRKLSTSTGKAGKVLELLLLLEETVIHSPSSVVMRRQVAEEIGGFNEQLSICADWEYWVRISQQFELGFLQEPLVRYRIHEHQMHMNIDAMKTEMLPAVASLHKQGYYDNEALHAKSVSKLHLTLGLCYVGDQHQYLTGLSHVLTSMIKHPKPIFRYLTSKIR